MKRLLFIITFLLIGFLTIAQQDKIQRAHDSLITVIHNSNLSDSVRSEAAIQLLQTTWADNPHFLTYIRICNTLSKKINNPDLQAFVNLNYGQYYNFTDQYDSARIYLQKAYNYYSSTNNHRFLAASCGEMGNSYCFNGDYRQCLDWFLKALEQIYQVGDTAWIAVNLNNIGNVYYYLSDTSKALSYYQEAYKLFRSIKHKQGIALTTNNIGVIFNDQERLDSAEKYFLIAIDNAKISGYLEQLSETYNHLSSVYLKKGLLDKALILINKSIKIARKTGNNSQLADNMSLKAEITARMKNFRQAARLIDSSLAMANQINSPEIIKRIYLTRFILDTLRHKYKSALYNYLRYSKLKDSLTSEKIQKDIANLQSVYQLKLTEKENRLLKAKQEKQQLILQRHRIIFVSIAVFILLIIIFTSLLWHQYKKIRRYNSELQTKNREILQKNIILGQQKEEILSQKEEIERQHKELMRTQNKIQESILYAKRIQTALLPSIDLFKLYFPETFIIFIPQETVSGDFYWGEDTGEKFYFAVGDCTGHGVPGAFISMMVITVLKEIVKTHPDYTAADILTEMRETVKKTFSMSGRERSFTDGADIALAILDTQTFNVNFAGAYRPMYIIRKGELIILKGNRQPIGSYLKEHPFTDQYIQLESNDMIYLFSDGYHDQIAATGLKKFMLGHFKKMLLEIHNLPLYEQKKILEERFYQWKQDAPQIDDITILGLKV